jgi:hypothetical protein
MSASGLFGLIFNLFAGAAIWTVLGIAVEKIMNIFNAQLAVFPTFQDVANGMNMMQIAWSAIMVIIFIGLCINYFVNEASGVPGEQ